MSSATALLIVEPLHRVVLLCPGDSQFAQSASSKESNPSGVHEKCLLFTAVLDFPIVDISFCLPLGVGGQESGGLGPELVFILSCTP